MSESFLNGRVTLHRGDCLEVLPTLEECSIDSVCTDPPYGLKFMGRDWDEADNIAFNPKLWAEVYRVLKPGAHLLSFGGDRTYHRMVTAIEDAGFEVRHTLIYCFGSGFPKSLNIGKKLDATQERCSCDSHLRSVRDDLDAEEPLSGDEEQDVLQSVSVGGAVNSDAGEGQNSADHSMRSLRNTVSSPSVTTESWGEDVLQSVMPRQGSWSTPSRLLREREGQEASGKGPSRVEQPSLERRSNLSQETGELSEREICPLPARSSANGKARRLHNGTSAGHSEAGEAPPNTDGVRSPPRPQPAEQSSRQFGAMAGQPQSQTSGTWPVCSRCNKPIIPDGLGTALKPAAELICMARKPLSESSIAANVLKHGTGAINVDGCRVEAETSTGWGGKAAGGNTWNGENCGLAKDGEARPVNGRWPANLIHDGSEEVLAGFPDNAPSGGRTGPVAHNWTANGRAGIAIDTPSPRDGDSGSAARFFYTAKADADDRLGSKHPTVKPLDLIQYLVRLITPNGGLVLDPFAGTGTTAEAAFREQMSCVVIEREEEYQADIVKRMGLCLSGPDERRAASVKQVGVDDTPLFGGMG
jgi:hypothetical protein